MNIHHIDIYDDNFADEIFRAVEKDYGRGIARIPKFKRISKFTFLISIIFADFRLLEAEIHVTEAGYGIPHIEIHGEYF